MTACALLFNNPPENHQTNNNKSKQKLGARGVNSKEIFLRTGLMPDLALFSVMALGPKTLTFSD